MLRQNALLRRFSSTQVVTLRYEDLVSDVDLSSEIEAAYGYDGTGFLTVSGVPGLEKKREALLPLAQKFALLDEEIKNKYVHEDSYYSFGWSHGKEKLQGVADFSKGSYYGNPQYNQPETDQELVNKYPAFIHPNIWPKEEMPELEPAFMALGQLIVHVGMMVAKKADQFVYNQLPSYSPTRLYDVIKTSRCAKARLLHYFARSEEEIQAMASEGNADTEFSDWCGWHNDHGSLTGLVSAMFLDEQGQKVDNIDESAGLYIRKRSGELVKAGIPADHIAFQIGETAQIHSGGLLQATPHAVKGSDMPGVSRETYAVFMEPMMFEPMAMPDGRTADQTQDQRSSSTLPTGVPPISSRWDASMDFSEFTEKTLSSYY
jgi:isopenicillin N synthase-like dioxygenase